MVNKYCNVVDSAHHYNLSYRQSALPVYIETSACTNGYHYDQFWSRFFASKNQRQSERDSIVQSLSNSWFHIIGIGHTKYYAL